jgi:hypothetical protein
MSYKYVQAREFKKRTRRTYIYGLFDPENPETITVVGKTVLPLKTRLYRYVWVTRNYRNKRRLPPSHQWVATLLNRGRSPQIRLLETCTLQNWRQRERRMISIWRKNNPKLLNVNRGGNGTSYRGATLVCELRHRKVQMPSGVRVCRLCKSRYNSHYRRTHTAYFERYRRSSTRRAYLKRYNNTPERRKYMREYLRGPARRAWLNRPEVKARITRNRRRRLRKEMAAVAA